jgi:methyl-accepting chemotaxis protein
LAIAVAGEGHGQPRVSGAYNVAMSSKHEARRQRHPIRNFIILPDVQWPYIIRILALVNLAGVLMATTICAFFYWRYENGPMMDSEAGMEMVNENLMHALVEENLMDVVIPAFVVSDVVSLLIGLWLALYFSRKVSVPIYRVKQWAETITSGDLAYRLKFRPGDERQVLEDACNKVGGHYASVIEDLRRQIAEVDSSDSPKIQGIKSTLERLRT